jgi:inner membrane protein
MATPLGHSLSGLIIYWLFGHHHETEAKTDSFRINWGLLLFIIFIANLPDLDFLPGFLTGSLNKHHHGLIHSFGLVVLVTPLLSWFLVKFFKINFFKSTGLIFLILATHLFIDYFTQDLSPPYGTRLLWPLSSKFYNSCIWIFPPFWRDSWGEVFSYKNFICLLVEVIFFGSLFYLTTRCKKKN